MFLAERPPMGWNSWNTFGHDISEELIMGIADAMVKRGLKEAGYEYVVIDDCWSMRERDENGKLAADPEKFPHGMKYLADYIHSLGLKFGIYSCCGTLTCAGYPGSFNHEFEDAETFASWGVDFLKYDNCYRAAAMESDEANELLYRRMGLALRTCGRDILYSVCNWGTASVQNWAASVGAHMYRTTGDIIDNPESFKNITRQNLDHVAFGGRFCHCDPDMLICGMYNRGNVSQLGGCTAEQYRSHFALWCIMGAPLMIGCDIRSCGDETLELLKCRGLIDIDRDPEARPPRRFGNPKMPESFIQLFRCLCDNEYCIGIFNFSDTERDAYVRPYDIGITPGSGYAMEMTDIFTGKVEISNDEKYTAHCGGNDCRIFRMRIIKK